VDILALVFVFFSVLLLVSNFLIVTLSSFELKTAIQRRLKVDAFADKKKKSLFLKILDLLVPVNYFIVNRFMKRQNLETKLFNARLFLMPEQFLAIKEVLVFVFVFLTYLFVPSGDVMPMFVLPAIGFLIPDMWLVVKIKSRKAAVLRALPDTVDLLSLCVDAGLDFMAATRWIIEKSRSNAFIEELSLVLHEIKLGKSRQQALKDMAKRLQLQDVTAFCRTLVQADRMGIPIAQALAVLADDTRERFFRRAERAALQAPMKMLIPLIFFILPVVGVIVGGPIILQFMTGGFGGIR